MADNAIEFEILNGVEAVVKEVKVANGYWSEISDTQVYRAHITINFDAPCQDPESYPKVAINTGSSQLSKNLSKQKLGVMTFPIIAYAYSVTEIDKALANLMKDIERAIEKENVNSLPMINHMTSRAAAIANEISVVQLVTDEGFLAPWGQGILRIEVKYRYFPDAQKPGS